VIQILEGYLHILEDELVPSDVPLLSDPAIIDYLEGHFIKLFEAIDTIRTVATEQSKIVTLLEASKQTGDFKAFTLALADAFSDLMKQSDDIKSGVLACVIFELEGQTYFGLLKLNFRVSYFHNVSMEAEKVSHQLATKHTSLPSKNQRVSEALIINLETLELYIRDKEITVDGRKTPYLTEQILGLERRMSMKRTLDIVTKTPKDDAQPMQEVVQKAKVTQYVQKQLDEGTPINVRAIAEACFDSETEREAYENQVRAKGVFEETIEIPPEQPVKVKETQKIKTTSGVEITLPAGYLAEESNLEIAYETDGSMTIKLKHLGEMR